ncbi:cytochrome P450 [Nocardia sp. NPDC060256]|uniref:cytochrome P450 n=1 Tax=unclassified Nocardia TaxID=2637762 RepID=UPI003655D4A6
MALTESANEAITLPIIRSPGCPFDPPTGLADLCEQRGLVRMTFPDGHLGWLATAHRTVRAVLGDSRFSARYQLLHDPLYDADLSQTVSPAGDFGGADKPEHTRLRQELTAKFTVRRMRLLTARIAHICTDCLDAMEKHGPSVDLVEAYARPVAALTICELLGVPYDDHEFFQHQVTAVVESSWFEEMGGDVWKRVTGYIRELVVAKRAAPTDDMLSELTTTELSDDEIAGMGTFLLGAGLETTRNMIALGTFALLRHPDQLAALRVEPELADGAVEELLRYLTVVHTGVRTALEDVELDGLLIKAGESVALSLNAANRDARRFSDPDTLNVRRRSVGHLAFGYGVHQCLGQQLARVELRVAIPALVARFPTLRLAIAPGEVAMSSGNICGTHSLPVTWE